MENTRQQKVARQLQKDISEILAREVSSILQGAMATVTAVRMSPDLGLAKVYVSVFPFEKNALVMQALEDNSRMIRGALGTRVRNQLRIVPELVFHLDDSLEYIDRIESLLK